MNNLPTIIVLFDWMAFCRMLSLIWNDLCDFFPFFYVFNLHYLVKRGSFEKLRNAFSFSKQIETIFNTMSGKKEERNDGEVSCYFSPSITTLCKRKKGLAESAVLGFLLLTTCYIAIRVSYRFPAPLTENGSLAECSHLRRTLVHAI